jgi:hypothetical protein
MTIFFALTLLAVCAIGLELIRDRALAAKPVPIRILAQKRSFKKKSE